MSSSKGDKTSPIWPVNRLKGTLGTPERRIGTRVGTGRLGWRGRLWSGMLRILPKREIFQPCGWCLVSPPQNFPPFHHQKGLAARNRKTQEEMGTSVLHLQTSPFFGVDFAPNLPGVLDFCLLLKVSSLFLGDFNRIIRLFSNYFGRQVTHCAHHIDPLFRTWDILGTFQGLRIVERTFESSGNLN